MTPDGVPESRECAFPRESEASESTTSPILDGNQPLEARKNAPKWAWILGICGLLAGFELTYQTGIRIAFPLALLCAFIGMTIDTRRFTHWVAFPLLALPTLCTIKLSDNATQDANQAVRAFNRGIDALKLGEHDSAIRHFNESLHFRPHEQAYTLRGYAWLQGGRPEPAVADCTRAIELDPRHLRAYLVRGAAFGLLGDYQQALQDCRTALAIDPNCDEAHQLERAILEQMNELERLGGDPNSPLPEPPKDKAVVL